MTLVREGSSEGRRPKGRRFGDRRYHRRSLGWLTAAAAAAVVATTMVVVEWCWGVGTGGKWGQINADMCGKLHRDRSQDPRGKRGLCVFLSVTPSLAPPLYIPSLPSSVLTLISLLSSLASSAWFSLFLSLSLFSLSHANLALSRNACSYNWWRTHHLLI